VEISEVEFYPPSLSFQKPIVDASDHADVYNVEKLVDGDTGGTSYYESTNTFPAYVVIDLLDLYDISVIVLHLPPALEWSARSQEIEIFGSNSNTTYNKNTTQFTSIVARTSYLFDPTTGNMNIITLSPVINVRFIKIVIYSNTNPGNTGAQLSEVNVY
jgi:hypothetical protein